MNIELSDIFEDFSGEEETIIKVLHYENRNLENQLRHTEKKAEESRQKLYAIQVENEHLVCKCDNLTIINEKLNAGLTETQSHNEALTESIDVNQIRHLLNEVKSYKSIIESLNKQIDSFREMEQSYENRIVELGDTKINLQKRLDDLDMEYQALGTKYDSLMQMSVLPMEA